MLNYENANYGVTIVTIGYNGGLHVEHEQIFYTEEEAIEYVNKRAKSGNFYSSKIQKTVYATYEPTIDQIRGYQGKCLERTMGRFLFNLPQRTILKKELLRLLTIWSVWLVGLRLLITPL